MPKKNITLEDLAIMVKHGFDEVYERFDSTDKRLDSMDERFDSIDERLDQTATKTELLAVKKDLTQKMEEGFFAVNRRIDLLHEDISDLPVIWEELKDLDERLIRVERKVSIGK